MTLDERLSFDERLHRYTLDGIELPSVTSVIRDNRLSADFAAVAPEVLEARRTIGKAVHTATHYYDEGTLDPSSVDPIIGAYVTAWEIFLRERQVRILELERRYAHPVYRFAGTIDRVAEIDGAASILDIKIGDPADAGANFQTAAYEQLYLANNTTSTRRSALPRWSVWLRPDRRLPYTVTPYREARDWRTFRSALDLTYARLSLGRSWRQAA